ncbi:protoporphyrinogen oxidase HemJ [Sulfurospirillum barnesii]|uniref:Protoporphyrinogen IX oxidase n=1 Tax=Sulfurospirillum barnesii (strain ATCC 700032 / DSM 10660 / SES-3) TaxID=760154 RepID=I3XVL7_SULBS|nr:protoporphyrinogen oxidase HemJ [Sulfurospirillum barnesii]AFL67991.1 TIGR00701 family protein [Sulfurospirillum barnesii SES-3]
MEYYSWILTFHVMSFMSWMAMLFYLPRLFVYHVEHSHKSEFVEVVKIQEYKIYKYIGLPAFWATLLSGAAMLIINPVLLETGTWLHAKIAVVALLTAYSFSLEYFRVQLEKDECERSGKFFRAYNEVPTMLSILIVGYVVVKTFSLLFTSITLGVFAFIVYIIMQQKEKKN